RCRARPAANETAPCRRVSLRLERRGSAYLHEKVSDRVPPRRSVTRMSGSPCAARRARGGHDRRPTLSSNAHIELPGGPGVISEVMRRRVVLGAALALALAMVGCGEGSDGSAEGMGSTPRAVQGLNAQSKWIAGGSIALLLGNPLSATGTEASLVSVVFFDPEATGGTCADRVVDGCTVSACTGLDVATPWVSAGAITLDDGTAPLVLEPTAENRYPSGGDWQSGDVVSVRVAGDTVPAFESEAQIPEELVVHTPEFEQSFDFNVDRS